jgi:hypothetical protein
LSEYSRLIFLAVVRGRGGRGKGKESSRERGRSE